MRKSYHFTIPDHEKENFQKVLTHLRLKEESITTIRDADGGSRYDFIVAVSKYELLYIRLACSHGSYVDIEAFKQKEKRKHIEKELKKAKQSS